MYDYLKGVLVFVSDETITLEVGGVGYSCYKASQLLVDKASEMFPIATVSEGATGNQVAVSSGAGILKVFVHHQKSETASALYGFLQPSERTAFRYLISVSGVGPKTAARIMRSSPFGVLCNSIATGNLVTLSSVKGLGKKSAEKIIVDLKKKMTVLGANFSPTDTVVPKVEASVFNEALLALKGLGYRSQEVEPILTQLFSVQNGVENVPHTIEEALTKALRLIAAGKRN